MNTQIPSTFPNTLQALRQFDARASERVAECTVAESPAAMRTWRRRFNVEVQQVRDAFLADTWRVNRRASVEGLGVSTIREIIQAGIAAQVLQ